MRRTLSALFILPLLALAPACDSDPDRSEAGDAFRNATGTFDINIQLSQADGGDDDGTILWEFLDEDIYDGEASEGNLLLQIKNNMIFTVDGVQTCTVNSPYLNSNLREVIAANGTDVLFTVWNEYVFEGEVDVKITNFGQMKKLFGEQLLFQFSSNEVYLGESRDGFRLLSANEDIQCSSDGRKLTIAALVMGECGAPGMPGYTF
jgi:hypothetical protein